MLVKRCDFLILLHKDFGRKFSEIYYSFVSNKRAVGNKRAGWIFSGILIIVQGGYDPSDA